MRTKSRELMERIKKVVEQHYIATFRTPSINVIADELGISKSTVYKYLIEMDKLGMVSYERGNTQTAITSKVNPDIVGAPVAGAIPCGPPETQEECIEEYIPFPRAVLGEGEFFVLHATGDSMVDAGIDDGDLVIVRKQLEAREGQIVAALSDGGSTLKRLRFSKEEQRLVLQPENKEKDYPVIKGNEFSIQGVAVKVLKNLN